MIRFAVIGTNVITEKFIQAARQSGRLELTAVYSRSRSQAEQFAHRYGVSLCYDSLEALAQDPRVEAVYIASPNSLHCEQAVLFLAQGKHVLCEKPLASHIEEAEKMVACARQHNVVLLEAFKTAWMPNFLHAQLCLSTLGPIRKAFLSYCQFSSRYPRYLQGENPNTFNPHFSNGSIMDIGYYCVASAVALFGEPQSILASAHLLPSGVDGHGSVILNYDHFDVTLLHSKVSDSALPSEIQGEHGRLTIGIQPMFSRLWHTPRGGETQDISQPQVDNEMVYEAKAFASLIEQGQIEHPALKQSLITARVLTEIRRQTGVVFPADTL